MLIELSEYSPSEGLEINAAVVILPENGVVIHKGSKMIFSDARRSSYLQLRSDSTISTVGAKGVVLLELSGVNASAFELETSMITFEIVDSDDDDKNTKQDLQIFINPSTLSPIKQIIQVISTQSLVIYYAATSNATSFNNISLKDVVDSLSHGITSMTNYLGQVTPSSTIFISGLDCMIGRLRRTSVAGCTPVTMG